MTSAGKLLWMTVTPTLAQTLVLALALTLALPASAAPPSGWRLVWADEFDVDGLPDPARWDYDTERNRAGWHNEELQYYARARLENSRVTGGRLVITARREALSAQPDYGGQQYTSARLVTRGKASWTYGYIEVRAKLPCGPGSWPAIWMLGTKGQWPVDGEIDIMEHVGNRPGEILGSVYTGASNWPMGTGHTDRTMVVDACGAFHDYHLTWTRERIRIGVDGRDYAERVNARDGDYAQWPFDSPQYLLLNLAVGGGLGGAVTNASLPWQFEVEYVRVYQP